jgi:integrase
LKTSSSKRLLPLVGSSKWANIRSASAALNKWLKSKIGRGYTIHSFRHSMRDRLRAVECPSEIIDQIGGWLTHGVGNSYGKGFQKKTLLKWMLFMADECI